MTKDDFATIKVGMPYLDLLNTVGIPDEIYVSGLLGYGKRLPLPIDYRILKRFKSILIAGKPSRISNRKR
ncbi:hypothetical protein SD436_03820 [Streptococcus sp. 2A/TPW/M5]